MLRLLGARLDGPAELLAQARAVWRPPLGQLPDWPATFPLRLESGEVQVTSGARPVSGALHGGSVPLFLAGSAASPALLLPGQAGSSPVRLLLSPEGGVLTLPAAGLLALSPAALLVLQAEIGRAAGLLPLHAAVLTRAGRTVAVTGPSGAGKSTAALRLLGRGWKLVAEDFAWWHPGAGPHGSGEVRGWDRGLRVLPQSLTRFAPHLLADTPPLDDMGKHLLAPPRQDGALPLSEVVALGPPLSRLHVVGALWGMVGVPLTPVARAGVMRAVQALLLAVPVRGVDRDALVQELG